MFENKNFKSGIGKYIIFFILFSFKLNLAFLKDVSSKNFVSPALFDVIKKNFFFI